MAYVVVSLKGEVVGHYPLDRPVSVGRSAECDVAVRDVLLSRRHCQLVPYRSGWIAQDLGSKNGTRCGGEKVTRRGLADGDVLAMGKTTVAFHVGPVPDEFRKAPLRRPADPAEALANDALSNTVSAFDPGLAEEFRRSTNHPAPRPAPPVPAAYAREDLYAMLSEIASSSWDSIYAQASRPARPPPQVDLVMRQPAGGAAVATIAPGRRTPAGAATVGLPRRTRLGFAEELQAKPAAAEMPRRIVRPKSPLAADVDAAAALVAREVELAGFTAFQGLVPMVPATEDRPGAVRRALRAVASPFRAVGRLVRGR